MRRCYRCFAALQALCSIDRDFHRMIEFALRFFGKVLAAKSFWIQDWLTNESEVTKGEKSSSYNFRNLHFHKQRLLTPVDRQPFKDFALDLCRSNHGKIRSDILLVRLNFRIPCPAYYY